MRTEHKPTLTHFSSSPFCPSSLQPSCTGGIIAEEEADYRANFAPGESKTLGSAEAFPLG